MTAKKTDLHTRAMLVTLSISSWTARKYDRKVSEEVAEAHGADVSAGRYNKHLLPTIADITAQQAKKSGKKVNPSSPNSYKELMQHIREVREWHYQNTLPWSDDGPRVLTVANYQHYTDYMRKAQQKFQALLASFVLDYPALVSEAQRLLNGMFNHEDYPKHVQERFDFKIKIDPVPAAGDWRVELSDEEIKILAESTEARARETFEAAQADAVKRLYRVVANIHERLTATKVTKDRTTRTGKRIKGGEIKSATFRDTLIENARELCDVLKRINLAEDPKLEEYRRQTELLATATEPETLRDDAAARQNTAARAQSILDAMKSTYGRAVAG